ncbi:DUF1453 domain-containing protein [Streptomyces sp. ID05-04B]|uniref:DUF1453 domain-containing protein n=1 Tax=unclassified Streptomyces TaxID=2593676 RepID=UPI000D1B6BD3|nr:MULTISPECIES: DUF1453 domain-containing protein [unclassified Streptomyces]AVV40091.1 DUF1453 domain-containing protein [Streptomyces sp. P3]MDX5569697.1 DUF1453 domain-containing protein [Streptomyces sp. ID05-04B]
MPGLLHALVIAAVIALVIVRQFRAGRIDADRRWWVLPGVLAVTALRDPDLLDARHPTTSALFLGTELVVGLAMGAAWAWTTRVWVEADGSVWGRSTRVSAAVWFAGIALRLGLFGLGVLAGLHQHGSALVLGLATSLLVRSGLLVLRARSLYGPDIAQATAYGDRVPRSAWKERV